MKDNFTPIGESYESLFEKLKNHDMIAPIPPNRVDPRARSFDPSKRCEYHSNAQGHNVESCRDLKREIERMIQEGRIVINNSDMEHSNPLENLPMEVDEVEAGNGLGSTDAKLSG